MILIGKSCVGLSQTTDTLCFPVPVIQKLLIDAKQKKYADSLVLVYRSDINILSGKIQALEIKDSTNKEISNAHLSMIGTLNQEKGIMQANIDDLKSQVKRQKAKTKLTAIGGLMLTAIVTGLFLFK